MAKSIAINKPVYSKMIEERIQEYSGYDTSPLEQCERTNATYYFCPVKKYADAAKAGNGTFNMTVSIHNPSNIAMKKAEILVP